MNQNTSKTVIEYPIWDRTVRLFHWVNFVCILGLVAVGTVILNIDALGISSDGKVLLKTVHVYIGYVFAINLGWRLVWGFFGNRYARWKSIIPFTKQHRTELKSYIAGIKENKPTFFRGHNPLGRMMVVLLMLLLSTQAITGLVLAGTDIYFPPFGQTITEWIAQDKDKLDEIKPNSKHNVDAERYQEMRDFRKPYVTIHGYVFYTLLGFIALHIIGVVIAEFKEKSGLISAMITGKKYSSKKPDDEE